MAASQAISNYKNFLVGFPSPFVAHVEINRPAKLNAFSQEVWLEFGRLFDQLSRDPDVRAVVLSGAGDRAFTVGLDVQAASQDSVLTNAGSDPARNAGPLRRHIEEFQACVSSMEKCEKRKFAEPRHALAGTTLATCLLHPLR
jgi:delta(3,5)-delta(2,4)-dienoyl-CoA isomerase